MIPMSNHQQLDDYRGRGPQHGIPNNLPRVPVVVAMSPIRARPDLRAHRNVRPPPSSAGPPPRPDQCAYYQHGRGLFLPPNTKVTWNVPVDAATHHPYMDIASESELAELDRARKRARPNNNMTLVEQFLRDELEEENQELIQTRDALKQTILNMHANLEPRRQERRELVNRVKQLERELDLYRKECSVDQDRDGIKNGVRRLERQQSSVSKDLPQHDHEQRALANHVQQLRQELSMVKQDCIAAEEEATGYYGLMLQLESELEDCRNGASEAASSREVRVMQQQLEEHRKEIGILEHTKKELETKIPLLERQARFVSVGSEQKMTTMKQQLDEQCRLKRSLELEKKELGSIVAAQATCSLSIRKLVSKEKEWAEQLNVIQQLESTKNGLETMVTIQAASIENQQSQSVRDEQKISSLQEELDEQRSLVEEESSSKRQLQLTVNHQASTLKEMNEKIQSLETKLKEESVVSKVKLEECQKSIEVTKRQLQDQVESLHATIKEDAAVFKQKLDLQCDTIKKHERIKLDLESSLSRKAVTIKKMEEQLLALQRASKEESMVLKQKLEAQRCTIEEHEDIKLDLQSQVEARTNAIKQAQDELSSLRAVFWQKTVVVDQIFDDASCHASTVEVVAVPAGQGNVANKNSGDDSCVDFTEWFKQFEED